jgi:type I restriction enzyme S subunit
MLLSKRESLKDFAIGDIASIRAGGDCPPSFSKEIQEDKTIPIYSNGIENNGLYGYTNKPVINERSITIAARGTIGFCVRREGEYVPIIRLLSVMPNNIGGDTYLHQVISRMSFKKNGSVQQQLTVPELAVMKVPYPTADLLLSYEALTRPIIKQINQHTNAISNLTKLRDQLLPLLMNGQVSVNYDLSIKTTLYSKFLPIIAEKNYA